MIATEAVEAVTPVELSKAAALFGTLKQLRIKLKDTDDGILDRAFEIHVQGVLEKLEQRLPTLIDKQLRDVEIIMARHGLYDAAFQQLIILCQNISPAMGDSLKDLRAVHSGFMTDLQQNAIQFVGERKKLEFEIARNRHCIGELEEDIAKLKTSTLQLDEEAEAQSKKILELRHHLREAVQEINHLRESGGLTGSVKLNSNHTMSFEPAAVPVYGSSQNVKSPLKSSMSQHQMMRNSSNMSLMSNSTNQQVNSPGYAAKLKRAQSGTKTVFDFDSLLQNEDNNNGSGILQNTTGSVYNLHNSSASVASNTNRSVNNNAVVNQRQIAGVGSITGTGLNTPSRGSLSINAPVNWLHIFRVDVQKAIDDGRCREITLRECKETIERLYESKATANEKALQGIGNLPMETLEQHTYRAMEKKYGLRNLAVEHVGMLLRALERYSDEDNDVSVFQRIFRNEVEEDFRLIQQELLKSLRELTMVQLMGKYPTKDQASLHTMLEARMATGLINEDEWKDMVNYLYNVTDSTAVCAILKRQAIEILDGDNDDGDDELGDVKANSSGNNKSSHNLTSSTSQLNLHSNSNNNNNNKNNNHSPMRSSASFVIGTTGTPTTASERNLGYDKRNSRDVNRLGYSSPTLKVRMRNTAADKSQTTRGKKELLKIPFAVFVKTILDFQLHSHQEYLSQFLKIFRDLDRDVDGVLNAREFKECYVKLRKAYLSEQHTQQGQGQGQGQQQNALDNSRELDQEMTNSFVALIKQLDPLETDRVIFSSAVTCLSKLYANK